MFCSISSNIQLYILYKFGSSDNINLVIVKGPSDIVTYSWNKPVYSFSQRDFSVFNYLKGRAAVSGNSTFRPGRIDTPNILFLSWILLDQQMEQILALQI